MESTDPAALTFLPVTTRPGFRADFKAGVPLRTAQAAMRHSDPSLTANVYTDPKLLDVAGAVASLPDLPLGADGERAEAVAVM
mgnify:FL=1